MKYRHVFSSFLLLAVFLALAPAAMASNTWYVDGVNGNDNNNCKSPQTACKTIGHAISLAASGDFIMVAAATYTENLTIPFSLRVIGADASTTIIDGGGVNTVVTISSSGAQVTLSQVTIRNGNAYAHGGGVLNEGALMISKSTITGNNAGNTSVFGSGGGILNTDTGTLIINNSTISDNTSSAAGGGIASGGPLIIINSSVTGNNTLGYGGGIASGGPTTIKNSTIAGNTVYDAGCRKYCIAWGGGINSSGTNPAYTTLSIANTTISGNSSIDGGGIWMIGTTLSMGSSTISGNGAKAGSGFYLNPYWGGSATLQNSIVDNPGGNFQGTGTVISDGYNLCSDNTCNFNSTGDMNNTDPKLGKLGNYGGPTQTIPLLSGSPAIDAGNPAGCTDGNGHLLKTDQRGKPRPDKEDNGIGCDMGAFERQTD